jgi:hypothetical protein
MDEGTIHQVRFWRRWWARISLLVLYLAALVSILAMTPSGYAYQLGAQTGQVLVSSTPVLLLALCFATTRKTILIFCILAVAQISFFGVFVRDFRAQDRVLQAVNSEILRRVKTMQSELVQYRMDRLFEILAGTKLPERDELIELKARAENGRTKLSKAAQDLNQWRDEAYNRIAKVSRKEAEAFQKGWQDSQKEPTTERLSHDYFTEIENLIDLLIGNYGRFKITSSGMIFESSQHAERYNELLAKIESLAQALTARREQGEKALEETAAQH